MRDHRRMTGRDVQPLAGGDVLRGHRLGCPHAHADALIIRQRDDAADSPMSAPADDRQRRAKTYPPPLREVTRKRLGPFCSIRRSNSDAAEQGPRACPATDRFPARFRVAEDASAGTSAWPCRPPSPARATRSRRSGNSPRQIVRGTWPERIALAIAAEPNWATWRSTTLVNSSNTTRRPGVAESPLGAPARWGRQGPGQVAAKAFPAAEHRVRLDPSRRRAETDAGQQSGDLARRRSPKQSMTARSSGHGSPRRAQTRTLAGRSSICRCRTGRRSGQCPRLSSKPGTRRRSGPRLFGQRHVEQSGHLLHAKRVEHRTFDRTSTRHERHEGASSATSEVHQPAPKAFCAKTLEDGLAGRSSSPHSTIT